MNLLCLVGNHKVIKKTVETESTIHRYSCKRCGCPIGVGVPKSIPIPPGSNYSHYEWQQKVKKMNEQEFLI